MTTHPVTSAAERNVALVVLAAGAVILAFAPVLVRLAEAEGMGPQATAFWRFAFSLPVLIALAHHETRGGLAPARSAVAPLGLAALFFGLDLAFWHAGIVRTTVANATLLANLTPVIVAVLAWLMFRERPTRRWLAGAVVALAGAALLAGASFSAAPERVTGDMLATMTAVWYALYMLAIQRARNHTGPFQASLWVSLGAILVSFAAVVATGESLTTASPLAWVWLALLGLVVHVGGQGAVVYALGRLPATDSAIVILVQPVAAAVLGFAIFGEAFGLLDWLGAGLVLCGIWLAQRRG